MCDETRERAGEIVSGFFHHKSTIFTYKNKKDIEAIMFNYHFTKPMKKSDSPCVKILHRWHCVIRIFALRYGPVAMRR